MGAAHHQHFKQSINENKQTKSGKVRELGLWSFCHWPPMCSASSNVLLDGSFLASAQNCGGFLLPSFELSRVHLALLFPSRSPSGCLPSWLHVSYQSFAGGPSTPPPSYLTTLEMFTESQSPSLAWAFCRGKDPSCRLFWIDCSYFSKYLSSILNISALLGNLVTRPLAA